MGLRMIFHIESGRVDREKGLLPYAQDAQGRLIQALRRRSGKPPGLGPAFFKKE